MDVINGAVRRIEQLTDDLPGFSRIGRVNVRKTPVDMSALLQETLAQLQPDLANQNIVWEVQPLPTVMGDHNLLRQVLLNFVSNAIKYSRPRNPARIKIAAESRGNEIIFSIADNGVGFDMKYLHRLFGVFQRLHHEREFEGTGIDLANVRRIIQRHGGRTWGEGKVKDGSTFYFSLPVQTNL